MTQSMTLFVLPFAGGNLYSYRKFQSHMPPDILMHPLEYPGRGRRQHETPLHSGEELARDICRQMHGHTDLPFSLYGHSLGALVGFLVCRELHRSGMPDPMHLFVSGSNGPSLKRKKEARYKLERQAFFELVGRIGGTPEAALTEVDLMCYLEPMLRADIRAYDTYVYSADTPLNSPITVFAGEEDPATTIEGCGAWRNETSGIVDVYTCPGNHFFIFDHGETLCRIMTQKLYQYAPMAMAPMHQAG